MAEAGQELGIVESDLPGEVSLEVVWVDGDMIELEAVVGAGVWRGRARAYSVAADIGALADSLLRFVEGGQSAEFVAGSDNGAGLIGFRFYRIDRAGHIAGFVRLASGKMGRFEQISRLEVEIGAETWGLIQFARHLAAMAQSQSGRVTLAIDPRP